LEKADLWYTVVDLCFVESIFQTLKTAFDKVTPGLVGVTFRNLDDSNLVSDFSFFPHFDIIIKLIKGFTKSPIVLGGSGFSIAPSGILERTGAEYGIVGDGERPLVELTQALKDGRQPSQIPGLVYRCDGGVVVNPPAWGNISQEPLSFHIFDYERYFREGAYIGIETKRGCPRQCCYCVDSLGKGTTVRTRAPEVVTHEMFSLVKRGINVFNFCDSEFNVDLYHAKKVCSVLIKHNAASALSWICSCTPKPFTDELASLMRLAGCNAINFNLERKDFWFSGGSKYNSVFDEIKDAIKYCKQYDIKAMISVIVGGPGESPATVSEVIHSLKILKPTCIGVNLGVRIYPNTELYDLLGLTSNKHELDIDNGFHGYIKDNDDLVMPIFYISPKLGDDPWQLIQKLIGDNNRFLFPKPNDENNVSTIALHEAIQRGHLGAYWEIALQVKNEQM